MTLSELINSLLHVIKDNNLDVFNCLDVMDNKEFLKN